MSIIVYIRRQDKLAISHFQQASKSINLPAFGYYRGGNKSLPSNRDNYDEYLDYNSKLSNWSDVFGVENIHVKVFEKSELRDADVVIDFLHGIGVDCSNIKSTTLNESNGFEKTKVGHLLNYSNLSFEFKDLIFKSLDNKGKSLPSRNDAIEFYSRYKESNARLNDKFKISKKFTDVFDSNFAMYSVDAKDLWDEDSANQAISNILVNLKPLDKVNPDILRDCAIALEGVDVNKSMKLMEMAHNLRPKSMFIKNKFDEYKSYFVLLSDGISSPHDTHFIKNENIEEVTNERDRLSSELGMVYKSKAWRLISFYRKLVRKR